MRRVPRRIERSLTPLKPPRPVETPFSLRAQTCLLVRWFVKNVAKFTSAPSQPTRERIGRGSATDGAGGGGTRSYRVQYGESFPDVRPSIVSRSFVPVRGHRMKLNPNARHCSAMLVRLSHAFRYTP